jgi:SAM-dependent methyltransferase
VTGPWCGLGGRLAAAGLTPRSLVLYAGSERLSALPRLVPPLAARPVTPANALLALCVEGRAVPAGLLAAHREIVEPLVAAGIVTPGDPLHARVAVLPVGAAHVVCDRLDAAAERELVCWPDDSSYHLARALPPGPHVRWIDLGCGSAFAPLARPDLAATIMCADLNPRAVGYARLGAELAGHAHVTAVESDLAAALPAGRADLVTCNAPIPDPVGPPAPLWRSTTPGFFARLFEDAARLLAPGGTLVVHGATDALEPVLAARGGERIVVRYTPPNHRGFGIAWWRPDAAANHVATYRALTPDRPHLEHGDRIAALAGGLSVANSEPG